MRECLSSDKDLSIGQSQKGFSLLELMMVVSIISILVLTAVPTFLGSKNVAYDAQTKENLRIGALSAKAYYLDQETYSGLEASKLSEIETSVDFLPAADNDCSDDSYTDSDQARIYVVPSATNDVMLCSFSKGSEKPLIWSGQADTTDYNF